MTKEIKIATKSHWSNMDADRVHVYENINSLRDAAKRLLDANAWLNKSRVDLRSPASMLDYLHPDGWVEV